MTDQAPNIREEMNNANPQRSEDAQRELCFGDLLGRLVLASAADETALDPDGAAVQGTINLAAVPSCVLHVVAVAGTGPTGTLELLIGAPGQVDPGSGQVVWNGPGSDVLRFNVGDAYTDVDVWYTVEGDELSLTARRIGQRDA